MQPTLSLTRPELALLGAIRSRHTPHACFRTQLNRRLSVRVAAMASTSGSSQQPARQLLSVAPMMDWTDLHYRQMARLLSRRTWLWTEMVVDKTLIHTQQLDRFLWFPPEQRPIVCQLGGSDPETLAAATKLVVKYGYDEINLNCGCPSDRVAGAGCFGAALMTEAQLVARCMAAMGEAAAGTPVNVKCRLGVDGDDSYEQLKEFVRIVSEGSPVTHFIVHARKCFLKGLNPHQNRTIPPIRYEWVYALKRDFPHLTFSLNGNIAGIYDARAYLDFKGPLPAPGEAEDTAGLDPNPSPHPATSQPEVSSSADDAGAGAGAADTSNSAGVAAVDDGVGSTSSGAGSSTAVTQPLGPAGVGGFIEGVMIGRQAYNDPWGVLADADRAVFGEDSNPATSRRQVLEEYCKYADAMYGKWAIKEDGHAEPGVRIMIKPLLNLFHGEKGSKKWKAEVDAVLKTNPASVRAVLDATLHFLPQDVLDAPPRAGPCATAAMHGVTSAAAPKPVTLRRMPVPEDRAGRPKAAGGDGTQVQSGSAARRERRAEQRRKSEAKAGKQKGAVSTNGDAAEVHVGVDGAHAVQDGGASSGEEGEEGCGTCEGASRMQDGERLAAEAAAAQAARQESKGAAAVEQAEKGGKRCAVM